MADIVIRGMAMPKDGRKHTALLQFLEDGKCRGIVEYSKSYDDRSVKVFEVVPLPEGHGRLGDLDALKADIDGFIECMTKAGVVVDGEMLYGKLLDALDNAKTIVPAEGSTEDDGNA